MLATACQMFMGKSEGEIAQIALETLEGHQRAIIAHLTVEVCNVNAEWRRFFFLSWLQLAVVFKVKSVIYNNNVFLLIFCHAYEEFICVGTQEIYQDRKKFSEQVFKVASSDLVNMGIGVVSYTLKDVHDDQVLTDWSCGSSLALSKFGQGVAACIVLLMRVIQSVALEAGGDVTEISLRANTLLHCSSDLSHVLFFINFIPSMSEELVSTDTWWG